MRTFWNLIRQYLWVIPVGILAILCGVFYEKVAMILGDPFTLPLVAQIIWMTLRRMPVKPIWATLLTFNLYLALGQWTQYWLYSQIELDKYYLLVNFLMLFLFARAAMLGPKGEIAKAQIGRLEWFGSPFPFNIILGQGNVLLPYIFGYEVLRLRVTQIAALSLELSDRSNGTVGITNWFRVVNPSRLDELDLEKQVLQQIFRIYEAAVRRLARSLTPDQFIGKAAIPGFNSPLEAIEAMVRQEMQRNVALLTSFGLEFENTAATDPKQSVSVNKAQNLRTIMATLTANNGMDVKTAAQYAAVIMGDASMIVVASGGSGGKKGGNGSAVIADADDDSPSGGGGKKGGGKGTVGAKEDTKLSDPPKPTQGFETKIILIIWFLLALSTFAGWGKNGDAKKKGQVTAKEVAASVVAFKDEHKNKLAPPYTKQFKIVLILKDKGDKNWITSKKLDVEGLPDTDEDGWVWNKWEGYQRAEVTKLSFPDDRIADALVEVALDSGDIVTYEKKGKEWYMLYDDTKSRVAYMPHIKRSVRFRVKILNPDPENLATVTVHREWSLKQ